MKAYLLALVLAAVSTALLIPVVRWIALRVGAVSRPGGRNVNAKTVPRLGGIAIAIGFVVPLVTIFPAQSFVAAELRAEWHKVAGVLAGALLLTTVGVLDDTRRVRALYKLLAQIIAACIVYAAGIRIDAVELPVVGILQMGVFALPVTIVWIVGIVNAVNLIDGLDGLAAGIVFFAGLTNFVVAYVSGEILVGAMMATMLGAVLGFLLFNFNPARIFMGDSGSYFLGFVLGTMSLVGSLQKASTAVSLVVPMLALGVPLFDTLFTMARRFLERRPIFSPDRGHIHHRLLDMGLTHRRAVLILYGVSVAFATLAIGVSLGRSWQVGVALIAACTVIVGLVRFLGYFEYILLVRRQRARVRSADTERLRRQLPEVISALASADAEAAIFMVLERLVVGAGLGAIELVPADGDVHVKSWTCELVADPAEIVSARYPLGDDGRARIHIRVRWWTSDGEVGAQTEVLLQVVADVVAAALSRTGSELAPREASVAPSSKRLGISPSLADQTRA